MQYVSDNLGVVAARGAMLGFDDAPRFGVHLGAQVAQWLAHTQASVWAIRGQARMSDAPPTHEVISSGLGLGVTARLNRGGKIRAQLGKRAKAAALALNGQRMLVAQGAEAIGHVAKVPDARFQLRGKEPALLNGQASEVVGKVHGAKIHPSVNRRNTSRCLHQMMNGCSNILMTPQDIRRLNLRRYIDELTDGNAAAFAEKAGKSPSQINDMLHARKAFGEKAARAIEISVGLPLMALDVSRRDATPSRYTLVEADPEQAVPIAFLDVLGSCGGGVLTMEMDQRVPLMKEPSWFAKYKVKPSDCLALWADGDSMADFIVDGDIVIFDTSKTAPRTGKIFLLEHPDGLRVKRLRQQFDRSWIMESNNGDKRKYPDEVVTADQAENFKILGEFIYRQGG